MIASRQATLAQFGDLDLLVIGGGIVGAGIARDAALRGLRVGLVEQYDFASGTSSRSSRLLHGGLRYLAQGRVGLVREASLEKRVLQRIAPHLAAPLAFVFPTYGSRYRGPWALQKLRLGVKLYDLLCSGRNLGASEGLTRQQVLERLPGVERTVLTGGVRYYDALTNDARLVLDTLRSARGAGALLLNYCRFDRAEPRSAGWAATVHDLPTSREVSVSARCIVNAAGPWADCLPYSSVRLRLTKGVHVVIDRSRLPIPDAVVMVRDRRILFAIPWGERVILGTTDTDFSGRPEAVAADESDVRHILDVVNAAFPDARLGGADVISTYAGVRPLVAGAERRALHPASVEAGPSDLSRSHVIASPQPGWWDISGGKLTTYRLMAQQTLDRIERYLGRGVTRCMTAHTPLLPETDLQEAQFTGILPPALTREAVVHYCHHEWAMHLDDVLTRRTSWSIYIGPQHQREHLVDRVSRWMAELMGWDEATRRAEVSRHLAPPRSLPLRS